MQTSLFPVDGADVAHEPITKDEFGEEFGTEAPQDGKIVQQYEQRVDPTDASADHSGFLSTTAGVLTAVAMVVVTGCAGIFLVKKGLRKCGILSPLRETPTPEPPCPEAEPNETIVYLEDGRAIRTTGKTEIYLQKDLPKDSAAVPV